MIEGYSIQEERRLESKGGKRGGWWRRVYFPNLRPLKHADVAPNKWLKGT